jgi:hypothetical protein
LRAEEFDFYIGVQVMVYEVLLSKALKVPFMHWLAYLPNPLLPAFLNLPSQSSYDLPTMVPNTFFAQTFRFDFPALKMMQIIPRHLIPILIPMLYTDEHFRPEFHGAFPTSYDLSFAFGYGVEGVRDVTHWPDNAQAFYPHSGVSSKFHEHGEIALPEDYQAFFDK